MEFNARNAYLENQVLTATPQKLRLMLIEAAIRFARQAIAFWERDEADPGTESLHRARRIVSELLSGIRPDSSGLSSKVAGVYSFLFRTMSEALSQRDVRKVADAVQVLEVEHETWRLLCQQLPDHPALASGTSDEAGRPRVSAGVPPDSAATAWSGSGSPIPAPGFLMDA